MRPRDPAEPGRVASTLELFFDLVFVVAVSTAGSQMHHLLAEGHVAQGVIGYLLVFFAIWRAWMNFSWFATSFDTDDWLYRVTTIIQMGGVLVFAAGIPTVFELGHADAAPYIGVLGYVIMRLAMVSQWLRAARSSPAHRRTALSYAIGISVVQLGWIGLLFLPAGLMVPAFILLGLCEVAVPVISESRQTTPWHPHHITERYGLFTLFVLGESLLASFTAVLTALETHEDIAELVSLDALSLLVTAGLWWIYFYPHHARVITTIGSSLRYGYGHYFVLAAAGAFSVRIELRIDQLGGRVPPEPTDRELRGEHPRGRVHPDDLVHLAAVLRAADGQRDPPARSRGHPAGCAGAHGLRVDHDHHRAARRGPRDLAATARRRRGSSGGVRTGSRPRGVLRARLGLARSLLTCAALLAGAAPTLAALTRGAHRAAMHLLSA